MNRKRTLLILIVVFLVWAFFVPKTFGYKEPAVFKIVQGEGSRDIALNLEEEGLIWWAPLFRLYVMTAGNSGRLQAGAYRISSSMNIYQMAKKFASGDIAKSYLTIPEGFTAEQIHERLKNITASDVNVLLQKEGYLFPDTYEIPYGMALEEIIEIMTHNFNQKTAALQFTSEDLIMASLLEKELRTVTDKETAAGILWKRLRVGMPLQVDAAPWTYENRGLPPSPICNPGIESLEAALNPQNSDYWYYLSTPAGETIFSKTLEEHNYAKAKYLK